MNRAIASGRRRLELQHQCPLIHKSNTSTSRPHESPTRGASLWICGRCACRAPGHLPWTTLRVAHRAPLRPQAPQAPTNHFYKPFQIYKEQMTQKSIPKHPLQTPKSDRPAWSSLTGHKWSSLGWPSGGLCTRSAIAISSWWWLRSAGATAMPSIRRRPRGNNVAWSSINGTI